MLTRRIWLAAGAGAAVAGVSPEAPPLPPAVALAWSDLPRRAQSLAVEVGLTELGWAEWRAAQRAALERRIADGSAEHVTYYMLQARAFTTAPPLRPMELAHRSPEGLPPAAGSRAREFAASLDREFNVRHRLVAGLARAHGPDLEAAYRHTMSFLRAKEIDRQRPPLDEVYFRRGLSCDNSPASTAVLEAIPGSPRRILLAGPGLDLTRREGFDDALPLESHQWRELRRRFPEARIDAVDVRPEVMEHLGARRVDVVASFLDGGYDLAVATNLLLYFADRELLAALAGFTRALAPGGTLLHNDMRFAAKVFGEALGLPVQEFAPRRLETPRRGVERWDRAVLHRKVGS